MTDQWLFKSETYDNCNCEINCGCQFNVPSTNGYCQSAYIGHIVEGHFNDAPLVGLNWAALYKWPGEIKDLNGKRQNPQREQEDDLLQRSGIHPFGSVLAWASRFRPMPEPPRVDIDRRRGEPVNLA